MTSVPEIADALQTVLGPLADEAARETGFLKRQRKLSGSCFVQTLVFSWLSDHAITLEGLSQTAALLGTPVRPQSLDARFTEAAAHCLRQVLEQATGALIAADPVAVPLLARFCGVYLLDASTISLPAALACVWPGCGGRTEKAGQSALKMQVRFNLLDGALDGLFLQAGRTQDRAAPTQTAPLPAGSLRLADLGFFTLDVLGDLDRQGTFFLSRLRALMVVFDEQGRRWDIDALLHAAGQDALDVPVQLGVQQRLPCRLLAARVPAQIAQQRRRRLREEARKKGQTVSAARLKMADWNIFVTNVPANQLSLQEALVLARARWQIELLFKLWKSHGFVDDWRTQKPWRILCEVYAKLLAMVAQHWLFLVCCWVYPDRSLFKAAQTVRRFALHLAAAVDDFDRLCAALALLQRCLAAGCRINKRKTKPHSYQLLLDSTQGGLN